MRPTWQKLHHAVLAGNCAIFLLTLAPSGTVSPSLGLLRLVSRIHPWLTHVSLGLVILILLSSLLSVKRGKPDFKTGHARTLVIVALLALDLTFLTGAWGQGLENYPNENIFTHKLWAAAAYLLTCFVLARLLGAAPRAKKKHALVITTSLALTACAVAAHWGGVVHKGVDYLMSTGTLFGALANSHHLFVHFVLAAVLFACFLPKQFKRGSLMFKAGLAIFSLSLLSGASLALRLDEWSLRTLAHYSLGILVLVSCTVRAPRPWIPAALSLLAITTGAVVEFGPGYFTLADRWTRLEAEKSGILPDAQLAKFQKSVVPVLERRCLSCHDGSSARTELRLDSFTALLGGTKFYNLVQGDEVDKSELYRRLVMSLSTDEHMPFHEGMLSSSEIGSIREWIENGGFHRVPGPGRTLASTHSVNADHWSLKRFGKPVVPPVRIAGGNEVDAFIFTELSRSTRFEIQERTREELIRDVHLDATGLIPPASEAREFIEDGARFEETVDRLIASPRFGENLALFWLDFTGFGETTGFEKSDENPIEGSFEYKKGLIETLNRNPSYFGILRDQLGRSDRPIARLPSNQWLKFQPRYGKDKVYAASTAMQTMYSYGLGMEMRCATCHNHVYAPISNEDYYSQLQPFVAPHGIQDLSKYRFRKDRQISAPHFLSAFESSHPDGRFWLSKRARPQGYEFLTLPDTAEWMTDSRDGVGFFTARVFVNAIWSFLMGRGIVENEADWMSSRAPPPHLALLNFLTHDFVEHGTSIKRLVRSILVSRYYRTRVTLGDATLSDRLSLSRPGPIRPENLRDNLLQIAGKLRKSAPEFRELKENYMARDPWLTPQPEYRYVFFARPRSTRMSLAAHFQIPRGYKSLVRRPAEAGVGEAFFFLTPGHFARLIRQLDRTFGGKLRSELVAGVDDVYLSFFSRHPSPAEVASWRGFFGGGPVTKDRLEMFFRVLISTNEFTTNQGSGAAQ